jgi:hypothetical protein
MTPSGNEPATFRFVAQYLNHCATISGPPHDKVRLIIYIQYWGEKKSFDILASKLAHLKDPNDIWTWNIGEIITGVETSRC